jgi:hypothetical protein
MAKGLRKLLMILANETLHESHLVVPLDTPEDQLELYRKEYRTVLRREDQGEICLSRLPLSDRRVGSGYEVAYSRFPAGNPRACLIALLVVLPPDAQSDSIMALVRLSAGKRFSTAPR